MSTAEAANKLSQEDLVALGESAASKGVEPQEALPIPEDTLTPKHTSAPPPISTSNAPASNPMSASNGPSPAPKSVRLVAHSPSVPYIP